MKRRLIWVLAALAAAIIVVGGCGSSGEGSDTTAGSGSATAESPPTEATTTDSATTDSATTDSATTDSATAESTAPGLATSDLTKAQFLKQANAICGKSNKEISDQFEAFLEKNDVPEDRLPSTKELREVAETIIAPVIGKQVAEMQEGTADAAQRQRRALRRGQRAIA